VRTQIALIENLELSGRQAAGPAAATAAPCGRGGYRRRKEVLR